MKNNNFQKGFLQLPILVIIGIVIMGTFIIGTVVYKKSTKTTEQQQPSISQPSELKSSKFYIKTDGARARECPSLDCKVLLYLQQNGEITFPSDSYKTLADLPEWVKIDFSNKDNNNITTAYVNKINFSESPQEIINSSKTVSNSVQIQGNIDNPKDNQPSYIICNGKYWTPCQTPLKFFCPSIGDASCINENQPNIIQNDSQETTISQSSSPPPDITTQVGSYISNKYSEFKKLVSAYYQCDDKYNAIIKPLETKETALKSEEESIFNKYGGYEQFYILYLKQSGTTDDQHRYDELQQEILKVGKEIVLQGWARNQECTPYYNLAIGKAPYEGVSSNLPQVLQQLNTPQQSYNYFECTTGYAPGRGWTTNCSDGTTCRTSCGAGSCKTTCY